MPFGRLDGRSDALAARVGSACGKLILLGEHAVVYGVPAIAVGIDRGVRAQATTCNDGEPSRLRVPAWNIAVDDRIVDNDLAKAFRALIATVRRDGRVLRPQAVDARADIPPGGGLGCSAAMGVAITRAIDPLADEDAIQRYAMEWERVFHGNPSGVDAAVATRGGCVFFRKSDGLEPVRTRGVLHLCVGDSGRPASTKVMVDSVARLRLERPRIVRDVFDGIRALVHSARVAIEAGDAPALGRLMDHNQILLGRLGVSNNSIERMCSLARCAGALGGKLTGAGGGGSVVALVASARVAEQVLAVWRGEGYGGFATAVAAEVRPRTCENEAAP
jgi:mevalonate kinase